MTLIIIPLIFYRARKSFGSFLLITYIEFVFFVILNEAGIVFPYGDVEIRENFYEDDYSKDEEIIYYY